MRGKVVAIVPAAGIGKRFGAGKNKLLYELSGKPLLIWTLEALEGVEEIDEIVPVLQEGDLEYGGVLIRDFRITKVKRVLPGGKERQDSVYCGIRSLEGDNAIVVVHDGARPFIDSDMVRRALEGLDGCDGAIAGVPVKDTIKECKMLPPQPPLAKGGSRGGKDIIVQKTLERSVLWSVQTPQVFRVRTIREAHERARSEGYYATDDAALVERYGGRIRIVEGSYRNIKVTTPEDIHIAEAILKSKFQIQ